MTDTDTIRKLRADGVSNADIASRLGISKTTLEKIVRANNMPPKPSRWPAIDMQRFTEEWNAGTTGEKMAKLFGVSVTRVRETARAAGLPPRAHGGRRGGMTPVKPRKADPAPVAAPVTLDDRLLATKGRYAALAEIADAEKMTLRQVTYRFHQVRQMPVERHHG